MATSEKEIIEALFAGYGRSPHADIIKLEIDILEGQPEEPHILFFQAEYDDKKHVGELANGISALGMTFFTCAYTPSSLDCWQGLLEFSRQVWQSFYDWKTAHQRPGPIVIMGRSIGAAIALSVAASHCKDTICLILESVFDKTTDFLRAQHLECADDYDPFCNRERMKNYTKPVMFIHSSRDEYVSISQAEWLVVESRSKATQFQLCPSPSRKTLQDASEDYYFKAIKDFMNQRLGRREPVISIRERLARTRAKS